MKEQEGKGKAWQATEPGTLGQWKQPEHVKEQQAAALKARFAKYLGNEATAEPKRKARNDHEPVNYWKWLALALLAVLAAKHWLR